MTKWKIVRNSTYISREVPFWGECPRFGKRTTLTMHLVGKQICMTDLQPTFSCAGFKCSLLEENNEKTASCKLNCPLAKKYKNSYDFEK